MFGLPEDIRPVEFSRSSAMSRQVRKEVYVGMSGVDTLILTQMAPKKLQIWYLKRNDWESKPVAYSPQGLSAKGAVRWAQSFTKPESRMEAILLNM